MPLAGSGCSALAQIAYRRSAMIQDPYRVRRLTDLVDLTTSSDDVEQSKPAPDIFEVVLKKLGIQGANAVAIGDTPYDASAAGKAGIATIGVLCGGFAEASLREAGSADVYPVPAALFARFDKSLLAK
jgi:beta-phosphoglucomutase-like phosphatase (HAD superfamily)